MSDDQKKQGSTDALKRKLGAAGGKLPGLGNRPSGAPLPGLGNKPSGAPLPGLAGKLSNSPLPGLGGKPSGAPLPGPASQPGIVPPFMQQQEEPAPAPEPQADGRDPFGQAPPARPSRRPSYPPGVGLIGESTDPNIKYSGSDAGMGRSPMLIGAVIVAIVSIIVGFMAGKAMYIRATLNITIRDAYIIEYELKKAAKLFSEVQSVVNAAMAKAKQREYEKTHVGFLTSSVKGNPIKPHLFTERNFKNFDPAAVQWMMDYANKWTRLDSLIQAHRRATKSDEAMLTAARGEFEKLLTTNYGVVFKREKEQFLGNVVVLGAQGKDAGTIQVQGDTGTFADTRTLYSAPEPGDGALTKEPGKYVIALGKESKAGLLKNATQSHFEKYARRLKEMSDLMTGMVEEEKNLLNKMSAICSQEPAGILAGGVDPEDEFAEYKARDTGAAAE